MSGWRDRQILSETTFAVDKPPKKKMPEWHIWMKWHSLSTIPAGTQVPQSTDAAAVQVPQCHQAEAPRGRQWFPSLWRLPGQVQSRVSGGDVERCHPPRGLHVGSQSLGSQCKPLLLKPAGAGCIPRAAAGSEGRSAGRGIADAPTQSQHGHHIAHQLCSHWALQKESLLPCFFHGTAAGTNRNYWAPQHFLFLHMQDASGQPAPVQNQENPAGGCAR